MGLKQIPTSLFIRYLTEILGLVNCGTHASHSKFDYPNNHPKGKLRRPLIVRTNYKDIPVLHIHTNLKTIDPINGKSKFEDWLNAGGKRMK